MQPNEFNKESCVNETAETTIDVMVNIRIGGTFVRLTKKEAKDLYLKLEDALDIDDTPRITFTSPGRSPFDFSGIIF